MALQHSRQRRAEVPMFGKNGAALVAVMMVCATAVVAGCSYGLTGECASGPCPDAIVADADIGKDSPTLGEGAADGSKPDASSTDTEVAGSPDSTVEAQSETDVVADDGASKPFCPPEGKPERTVEFSAKDGPTCGTLQEQKFAEAVGGGKEWYAVSCKTFGNANNCSAMTEVYSFKYVPETWTDAPKEQLTAYAGCSYVGVTMPNNKKAPITEYALVSCDENECVAVTPKPAYKVWFGELRYNFKTKLLTVEWFTPGDTSGPMIFKLVK